MAKEIFENLTSNLSSAGTFFWLFRFLNHNTSIREAKEVAIIAKASPA